MSLPERFHKTEALILKRMDYSEADYLVTLYTPEYGKLNGIARNARKPTNHQAGNVELYSLIYLMLKRGREDLHIITQAETRQSYTVLRENVERHILASHMTELLEQFAFEGEANPTAFDLLVSALGWLCDTEVDMRLAVRYYEFHLLRVMGFEPSLFECVVSGEDLPAQDLFFCAAEGGVVLPHYTVGLDVIPLSLPVFKILRHFSRQTWEVIKILQPDEWHYRELERLLHQYLTFLLERRLRSVAILKQVQPSTSEKTT